MINVVMLVKNRPRLTYQALWTLMNHTHHNYNLTVVDDCSGEDVRELLSMFQARVRMNVVRLEQPCGCLGRMRNLGAWWSEQAFGREKYLYFSDNDVYFIKGWDAAMKTVYESCGNITILGGQRHPFHLINSSHPGWVETDAVAGYSHWMDWNVWDLYGPYPANAIGIGQSEDFAICQASKTLGGSDGKVGYIAESAIHHVGLTNSNGEVACGAEAIGAQKLFGVVYE